MKIKDYGLIAVYQPRLSNISIKEFDFTEEWPNLLIRDYTIDILYMGLKIVGMGSAGADYDGSHRYIEVLYHFPLSESDPYLFSSECERVQMKMISKDKDLRPMISDLLRDECEVAIKLPESDFQLTLAASLGRYLNQNNIKPSAPKGLFDNAHDKIKRLFGKV